MYVYACYFLTIYYILYWLSRPLRTCMKLLVVSKKAPDVFLCNLHLEVCGLVFVLKGILIGLYGSTPVLSGQCSFVLNANWCWPNLAQGPLFWSIFCARIVLLFHFLYLVPDCLCLDWLFSPVSCYPVCVLHQCFIVGSCPSVAVHWCSQFSLLVFRLVFYFDVTLIKHCVWIHLSEFATLHIPHIIISSSEA